MSFTVKYQVRVVSEDIPKLSSEVRGKIMVAIEKKLQTLPETFGKPLQGSLKGYRSLRIGDHRVVFRIEKSTVKVFVIGHRSIVYKIIEKRT